MQQNFALIGAAGYIAPRHLQAIQATGNNLIAAVDTHDSVGILDRYSYDVDFFTEIERFDRHLNMLKRGPEENRVHWLSVCTPNYLHDPHCRLGLRVGANVICEKPLVINPSDLEPLAEMEEETGGTINTVLQLRLHSKLMQLQEALFAGPSDFQHDVCLTYITARSKWYDVSWKGFAEKSGGVAVNIGIHLFDMLLWFFGEVGDCVVHHFDERRISGYLEFERAKVRWFLSVEADDLPFKIEPGVRSTYRSITIDGEEVEFTQGFTDLHTRVYEHALRGEGFRIPDVRPSIELTHRIKNTPLSSIDSLAHPFLMPKK